jgi:hypothetical protein
MRGPVQFLGSKLFSSVKESTLVANWSSLKGQKTSGIRRVLVDHCFSNMVLLHLRGPQNIVRGSDRNSGINTILKYRKKNYKYTPKCSENFCLAIGNSGIISVR